LNKQEKEQNIFNLQGQIDRYKGAVLTNFRGLNVGQMNQIRQRLREDKISYHVVKNTLMKRATQGTDFEKINRFFEGPTAVAISRENPVALVKIFLDLLKTQPSLEIKVALVEGEVVSPGELKGIASLPSREVLMAQLLGVLQGPARQLAGDILSTFREFLYVLQARIDQVAASEPPTP
jgi:large subunit ribosomal protein L10